MFDIFKEMFYWQYYYLRKLNIWGDTNRADTAAVGLGFWQTCNIGSALIVANYFLKIEADATTVKLYGLTLAAILLAVNHFAFYKHREAICHEYENLPPRRRRAGKMAFLAYIVLSVVLFFYLASTLVTPVHGALV
jgi:lipid-A-disaccharide synthase-like uncharacterized protein